MEQLQPNYITASATKCPDCWDGARGDAHFEIAISADQLEAGWKLVRGTLHRRGGDYDARLYYDLGNGFCEENYFPIPTSGKGVINEVAWFPAGIRHLGFVPACSPGEFELSGLSIAAIGEVERIWRMARRVMAMNWQHPAQKRKLIGLSILRMISDLQGAYDAANKLRAHAAAPDYQDWIAKFDTLVTDDEGSIKRDISGFKAAPRFHVLVAADGAVQSDVQNTLQSLLVQVYRGFHCTVLGMEAAGVVTEDVTCIAPGQMTAWQVEFDTMLANDKGPGWLVVLRAGDVLAPHALYRFANEAGRRPDVAVIYADDDRLDANGLRCDPRFKPDWSLAHLRATNFIGDAVALRANAVASAGGLDADCFRHGNYDLLLRVVDAAGGGDRVAHIPAVLLYTRAMEDAGNDASEWDRLALQAHLARNNISGDVAETLPGCRRVRYGLPAAPPLVSIIVPTRNGLELIRQCVESLLAKTTYPNYEIVVVDNQSTEPAVLAYLEQIAKYEKVRVLHYDQPFNFSAMNNMAVRDAHGDAVCLLNNDTEVISPDWLEEMVGHLVQDKVGIVGAKLYYPGGRVQHAGDLVGVGGVANHAHAYLHRDEPGYCNRAMVAQELSAVTAACLVTWRSLYLELGGLDEKNLPVAFNDVDYCLRVREAGYRVVWTPHAELYHHESVSRGKDSTPAKKRRGKREVAYMRKRWKRVLQNDPFYNPNLSYERPDFSLSHAPLVTKPWE